MKKILYSFSVILIMVTMSGCKTSQTAISKEAITASGWQLTNIMGKEITASDYAKGVPDATFTTENRISGNGGCNSYNGPYTLDEKGNLSFGMMISTKMFCPGNGEGEYMKTLGEVNKAKISNNKLILLNGDKELLVFMPKKGE